MGMGMSQEMGIRSRVQSTIRIKNVSASYPPTLLLHGKKDTDVPFNKSVKMAEAFDRHQIPYRLLTDSEWEHMLDGPDFNTELEKVLMK
ncbi:MAG: dipeptidyl aminopeptidase/acylaminoacyl peptidase [Flavobacterium sp.]|jgi:dipeptidyl aminopeptidase/acylaminoacyl peptidase